MTKLKIAALGLVVVVFGISGTLHFLTTDNFVAIMPPYMPMHLEAVYISGVFELLGAAGLLFAHTRRIAGWGLIALTILVTPANVHMWMNADLFPDISPTALLVRLPIQLLFILNIWWATKPPTGDTEF
jgi:uncharacterized membrane protein